MWSYFDTARRFSAATSHNSALPINDLFRLLPGEGCDAGIGWVIEFLIREALTPVDVDAEFEESVRASVPETTKVGWLELDTVTIIRDMDPVSWELAQAEWIDLEEGEGHVTSFGESRHSAPVSPW